MPGYEYGLMLVLKGYNDNYRNALYFDSLGGLHYAKINEDSQQNNGWHTVATATPPQEYDLPLAEGITAQVNATYCKTQEGIVFVAGWVQGAALSMTVATLPAGYRPNKATQFAVPQSSDADKNDTARIEISSSGAITVRAIDNEVRIANGLSLCCSFVAAS